MYLMPTIVQDRNSAGFAMGMQGNTGLLMPPG
jgi:hypothetical protein